MSFTRYKIVCTKCKGSSIVEIDNMDRVFWVDTDRVISARKRLDNEWGFQCSCGNNDIMTQQESRMIANQANPKPEEITDIMKNLIIEKSNFVMETV